MIHVLCEVVKSGPVDIVQPRIQTLTEIATAVEASAQLNANTLIRKFNIKLISRIALRTLPGVQRRRAGKLIELYPCDAPLTVCDCTVRSLASTGEPQVDMGQEASEQDVPETVELALERLFSSLQDRVSFPSPSVCLLAAQHWLQDTVVRWSAAKGVARITERLPMDFAKQVVETVMDLYNIHSIAAASMYQLPATAEATWHGASLACAEISRRGLVRADRLSTLIDWMLKVRQDISFLLTEILSCAARHCILTYEKVLIRLDPMSVMRRRTRSGPLLEFKTPVLWLLMPRPCPERWQLWLFSIERYRYDVPLVPLSRSMSVERCVQDNVVSQCFLIIFFIEQSLFPHGIDVLRKTDFYAVSIRKNSFLVAAPQVAEYVLTLPVHVRPE